MLLSTGITAAATTRYTIATFMAATITTTTTAAGTTITAAATATTAIIDGASTNHGLEWSNGSRTSGTGDGESRRVAGGVGRGCGGVVFLVLEVGNVVVVHTGWAGGQSVGEGHVVGVLALNERAVRGVALMLRPVYNKSYYQYY